MKAVSYFVVLFSIVFSSCSNKPEFSKDYVQGSWECYDYTMNDVEMNESDVAQIRETMRTSTFLFEDSILYIQNPYLKLAFTCQFNTHEKTIVYTQLQNEQVAPSFFTVEDFTPNTMVLVQSYPGSEARTFLQRAMKK